MRVMSGGGVLVAALLLVLSSISEEGHHAYAQEMPPAPGDPSSMVCSLETRRCPTGQWISQYPYGTGCVWEECAPLTCSSSDPSVYGCSGTAYENKCDANIANDYCDLSIRLEGQSAMNEACPLECQNIVTDLCSVDCLAADGTCACAERKEHDEEHEGGSSTLLHQLQRVVSQVSQDDSQPIVNVIEGILNAQGTQETREEVLRLLEKFGDRLRGHVEELILKVAKRVNGMETSELKELMLKVVEERLGITENDLLDNGIDIGAILEEANAKEIEEVYEENENELVETVLTVPGEVMSPDIELIGPQRAIKLSHGNGTDSMRVNIDNIAEVDRFGNVVRSYNIDRLLRLGSISTIASDVNLGTPDRPVSALEILLSYPVDKIDFQCPGNARTFADTVEDKVTMFLRAYLLGKDSVEINYLGDRILLHPFSMKYTIEVDNWPFCEPTNRLQLTMMYKYKGEAENSEIVDIDDLNLPANSDIEAGDVSFDTLVSEESIGEFEEELEDLLEENGDMLDDLDLRRLLQMPEPLSDVAEYIMDEFEEENDDEDDDDDDDDDYYDDDDDEEEESASEEIQDALKELPPSVQKDLANAIVKLHGGASTDDLTEDEVTALEMLLKYAEQIMFNRTKRLVSREVKLIRRERMAISASLAMMRRRLQRMRRTFSRGKVASGFGNAMMFMPENGLVAGVKTPLDIELTEESDRRLKLVVTFPNCSPKCIWDPTIEYTENAVTMPPLDSSAFSASTMFTTFLTIAASVMAVAVLL